MLARTRANKIKALSDYWTFIDLIDFRGGRRNFAKVHHDLGRFVTEADKLAGAVRLDGGALNEDEIYTRTLVLMPRGHLKSTVSSVGYTLWRIYRNPNIRIAVGTNVKDLAWSFIRELRSYLEDEVLKEQVWNARPHVSGALIPELDRSGRRRSGDNTESEDKKVIWSSIAIQVNRSKKLKEPTVVATSVGSRLTGGHFDLLILDDIVDFKNTASLELIKKTFEWAQDLESVLDPRRLEKVNTIVSVPFFDKVGDQLVVLGTRYAKGDYYEYIIQNQDELGYQVLSKNIYINGKDDTDGYLWGEKFNAKVIGKLRKRLTARRFASQYLNTIIVAEDQPLNPDNIIYFAPTSVYIRPGEVEVPTDEVRPNARIRPYLVVDPAISEKKSGDNTSICVGGFDQYGRLWILEVRVGKFRPLDTARYIYDMVVRWKLNFIHMEQRGGFRAVAYTVHEHLRDQGLHVGVKEYTSGTQNKKTRIENYLEPFFRESTIYLPSYLKTNDIVQNEIQFFPADAVTDDVVDTFAMIVEVARPPLTDAQKKSKQARPVRAFRNIRYGGVR